MRLRAREIIGGLKFTRQKSDLRGLQFKVVSNERVDVGSRLGDIQKVQPPAYIEY
jgi:hypothetical protein